ncbi:hypothetical protein CVT24_002784 [Panaeolus cyanescens]|uniref:Ecp2 effector protein-like domain-containing protein n=1 Tax=Panaeolus cyanescens TaxID=181874 RepID=A0A409YRG6_9AGAR|nr:hypothetical protein CVT24_002784 [Panaeolus cyanescens]
MVKFFTSSLILSLVALAIAAPTNETEALSVLPTSDDKIPNPYAKDDKGVTFTPRATSLEHEARDWINNCGDSTFINQSSPGSPLVADCQRIAQNIAGGGTWHVALIGHHQLVQYGTCAFGVQAPFAFAVWNYRVGNSDIIDLINDSIARFQWFDKVGAKGVMACQSDPSGQFMPNVEWGIYHT